ncbi:ubiquinol cytochrome-c reductase [Rhypophila sp. PSN 637]
MACRGCSKSGLVLFARGATPTSSRASFLETNTNLARIVSSSTRPDFSQKQQRDPRYRSLHTSAKRPSPAENKISEDAKQPAPKPVGGLAKLLKSAVGTSNTYVLYGMMEGWAKLCAKQAEYTITKEDRKADKIKTTEEGEEVGISSGGIWHNEKEFHLLPTFSTWSQVGMLHMYLLAVRFRALDKESHDKWQKQLVDHFFYLAEAKMDVAHDMSSSSLRQRYLKDLFVQWRGVILAYDEGLVKGDAVLASAVWRNLFKAREDVDLRVLAAVVAWMRNCLRVLDRTEDADLPLVVDTLFAKKASDELPFVDGWSGIIEGVVNQDAPVAGGEGTVKKTSRFS